MWEATLRVCLPDSGQAGQENISWQRVSRLQPVLVTSFPVSQIRTVIQRRSRPGSRLSSKHSWNARKPPVRVHSLRKSFTALRYFGEGTHIVTCRRQVTIGELWGIESLSVPPLTTTERCLTWQKWHGSQHSLCPLTCHRPLGLFIPGQGSDDRLN